MRVIGKGERSNEYIVIVTHSELEKCTDKYYGKLLTLNVGSEFDIGAGYDFRRDIQQVCKEMTLAMKSFEQAQATMTKFAVMVSQLQQVQQEENNDN